MPRIEFQSIRFVEPPPITQDEFLGWKELFKRNPKYKFEPEKRVNYRFFGFILIIILLCTAWHCQAQILQFRTKKIGYCKLINGQKMSNMTWVSAPNGSVIIDFDKGNIFISGTHYMLFKVTHTYDPQYSTAYILYKYDTKDSIGNKVTFAL